MTSTWRRVPIRRISRHEPGGTQSPNDRGEPSLKNEERLECRAEFQEARLFLFFAVFRVRLRPAWLLCLLRRKILSLSQEFPQGRPSCQLQFRASGPCSTSPTQVRTRNGTMVPERRERVSLAYVYARERPPKQRNTTRQPTETAGPFLASTARALFVETVGRCVALRRLPLDFRARLSHDRSGRADLAVFSLSRMKIGLQGAKKNRCRCKKRRFDTHCQRTVLPRRRPCYGLAVSIFKLAHHFGDRY